MDKWVKRIWWVESILPLFFFMVIPVSVSVFVKMGIVVVVVGACLEGYERGYV